jgi:hypothetical protein
MVRESIRAYIVWSTVRDIIFIVKFGDGLVLFIERIGVFNLSTQQIPEDTTGKLVVRQLTYRESGILCNVD